MRGTVKLNIILIRTKKVQKNLLFNDYSGSKII